MKNCKCNCDNDCCKKKPKIEDLHVDVVNPKGSKTEIYGRIVTPNKSDLWILPKNITECYQLIYDNKTGKFLEENLVFTEILYPAIWPYCTKYWDKINEIRELSAA